MRSCCLFSRTTVLQFLHRHGVVHTSTCQHLVHTPSVVQQRKYSHFTQRATTLHRQQTCLNSIQLRQVHGPFNPITHAYTYLNLVHDSVGAPWWISIAVAVIPLRILLGAVCQRYAHHNMTKEGLLQQIMAMRARDLAAELQRASAQFNWTKEERKKAQFVQLRKIQKQEMLQLGYHPFKSFIIILPTLPVWISMSVSLFRMAGMRANSPADINPYFAMEGGLWFPDLMVPDATLMLPLLFLITSLLNGELHDLTKSPEMMKSKFLTITAWVSRGLSVMLFFIALNMPSALPLYWTYSMISALLVNLIMRSPKFRLFLKMPHNPKVETLTPYSDLYRAAKKRYDLTRFIRRGS